VMLYVFPISFSDLACSVAGITSDANVLTNQLRLIAQRYYSSCYIIFFQVFFHSHQKFRLFPNKPLF